MARCQIIAELATNHGGNLQLAKDMISLVADAGADWVKTQAYDISALRHTDDPQYAWLKQAALTPKAHTILAAHADKCGVKYLVTAFTREAATTIMALKLPLKIGHQQAPALWWQAFPVRFVSWAWGHALPMSRLGVAQPLATVPLYPAPLSTLAVVTRQVGWSDHCVGLEAAQYMIATGAQYVEKHFSLPPDFSEHGRRQAWDMGPGELKALRRWAEQVDTMGTGVEEPDRWR